MKKLLQRLFDLREGEGMKASLMFSYGFLIITCLNILKPVRNSLFLSRFGVEKLPFVYILVAIFAALVASLYAKIARSTRLHYMISLTFLASIGFLLGFWLLLRFQYQGNWFLYAFYIWVALFGVLTGSQFWLLANDIYNPRDARRLFGFIGAGTISGGIFGGYLTNSLAPELGSMNLLLFCIGFLAVSQILVLIIWKKSVVPSGSRRRDKARSPGRSESRESAVRMILKSRHLAYLAGIISVGVVVANLVDYQFSAVASRAIPDPDRLTAFFGFWLSTLNIVSLAVQLFFTGRIMKSLGVTATLFFLPVGLCLGAAALLVAPALWSAVLIKVSDGGFKHSINNAGTELLILPVPADIKNKAKAFIDVFLKNLAKGIGGILLIALTIGLGFKVPHISLAILALLAVWGFLIMRVKGEYIDAFRRALEKRSLSLDDQTLNLEDASVFKSFLSVLEGENERRILYVLQLLQDVKNKQLVPYLKALIKHPSPQVKAAVLRMAPGYKEMDVTADARELVLAADLELRNEAVCYLLQTTENKAETIQSYLNHEDIRVKMAALICAASEWRENKDFRSEVDLRAEIESMLNDAEADSQPEENRRFIQIQVAKAVGESMDAEMFPYLRGFLENKCPEVMRAAVLSVGRAPDSEFIPFLIENLNSRHNRKCIRETLAEFGESVIPILAGYLEDEEENPKKRRAIPKVLALIGSQKSVNCLITNLVSADQNLRYEIIRALNKLRVNFEHLKFDHQKIQSRIQDEIAYYRETLLSILSQQSAFSSEGGARGSGDSFDHPHRARRLMLQALEEKLDHGLERMFRLLGLKYPARDMLNAYLGLNSNKPLLRANALEFLDNVLEPGIKRLLIPMVETTRSELETNAGRVLGSAPPGESASLTSLLRGDDAWLTACVLYLISVLGRVEFAESIRRLAGVSDPLVKETARLCLRRLELAAD